MIWVLCPMQIRLWVSMLKAGRIMLFLGDDRQPAKALEEPVQGHAARLYVQVAKSHKLFVLASPIRLG